MAAPLILVLRLAALGVAALLLSAAAAPGEIAARPGAVPASAPPPGLRRLPGGGDYYVPAAVAASRRPAPLLLLLAGTGGTGRSMIAAVRPEADRRGIVLVATNPSGGDGNWDTVDTFFDAYERGSAAGRTRWPIPVLGRDASRIDAALAALFARIAIDRERIGILGFSHGASFALTLGAANPRLFSTIIALSPGILVLPASPAGGQRVYVSHGTQDPTLPFARTRDSFLPRLASLGFRVTFRPFEGGHVLPRETLAEGIDLFLAAGAGAAAR